MSTPHNQLLASLPRADRAQLLAQCETVQLVLEEVLYEPGQVTRQVYFPIDSFISQIAQLADGHSLEVGMVGREGMLGVHLSLGVPREPLRAMVQGGGSAWCMSAVHFRAALARSPPLQLRLHKYLYVLMAERAASAACLRFHEIGPRLARWLLMTQDRAQSDQFPLTQEFVALMLGVRRVGVTAAAGLLQQQGLIAYRRGELTVLDRTGLEAAACSCYAADRRNHAQTMGPRR